MADPVAPYTNEWGNERAAIEQRAKRRRVAANSSLSPQRVEARAEVPEHDHHEQAVQHVVHTARQGAHAEHGGQQVM